MDFAAARIFVTLIAGHLWVDGPLQPRALSKAKVDRWEAMALHAGLHGTAVAIATRQPVLGLAEASAHAAIDTLKRSGRLTIVEDQLLHIVCKAAWAVMAASARNPKPRISGDQDDGGARIDRHGRSSSFR